MNALCSSVKGEINGNVQGNAKGFSHVQFISAKNLLLVHIQYITTEQDHEGPFTVHKVFVDLDFILSFKPVVLMLNIFLITHF